MDKTPREAALCGCVIWVLAEGAAAYEEDVPLPSRYRCASRAELTRNLAQSLASEQCYAEDYAAQATYRQWVYTAPARFKAGVAKLVEACGG